MLGKARSSPNFGVSSRLDPRVPSGSVFSSRQPLFPFGLGARARPFFKKNSFVDTYETGLVEVFLREDGILGLILQFLKPRTTRSFAYDGTVRLAL